MEVIMKKLLLVLLLGSLSLPGLDAANNRESYEDEKEAAVAGQETVDCAVCLGSLEGDMEVGLLDGWVLPCGHASFHKECLKKWLPAQKSCPLCRAKVLPDHIAAIQAPQSSLPAFPQVSEDRRPVVPCGGAQGVALTPQQLRERQEQADADFARRLQAEYDKPAAAPAPVPARGGIPAWHPANRVPMPVWPAVAAPAAAVSAQGYMPPANRVPMPVWPAVAAPAPVWLEKIDALLDANSIAPSAPERSLHQLLLEKIPRYGYPCGKGRGSRLPVWPVPGEVFADLSESDCAQAVNYLDRCTYLDVLELMNDVLCDAFHSKNWLLFARTHPNLKKFAEEFDAKLSYRGSYLKSYFK